MANPESKNEILNHVRKWSLRTERQLSHLKSNTKLSNLKSEIKKSSNAWKFEFKNISRDWKYKVYLYTIEKHWTPSVIKYQTVKKWMAKSKDQIKITNKDWIEYKDSLKFSAWDKVYVKIETKPQAEPQAKPQTKPSQGINSQGIEIQQSNIWKLEYKNISSDWKFEVYSYVVDQSTTTQWEILNKAKKKLNLNNTRWLGITNSNWVPYKPQETFKIWEKIYLKIPVSIENNIQIIDGMKRKWWEYFWIDVSRYNDQVNLTSFEERNRKKWDSIGKDKRWVSFIYIRAGDGHPNAKPHEDKKSVTNWTNFIKKYNSDRKVKDGHEQIATWFYWTLTNKKSVITQADDFLETYNNYKHISWWEKLIPMIDLETDRRNEVKKIHKDKKGKIIKREFYSPQEFKESALKWLQYVEQKTWVVPGIYVWAKAYGDHLKWDNRFNKYLTWLSAYSSNNSNGREDGNVRRINFKEWSVNVWSSKNPINIKTAMYQSSQEWSVPWTAAKHKERDGKTYYDTDMDHTKDITKLFSKNNKSK